MKKRQVTYVEWDDAKGISEWLELEHWDHEPCQCKSVGFLVKEDARGLSLAGCVSKVGHIGQTHYVPKAIITRRFDSEIETDMDDGFDVIIGPGKDNGKKPKKAGPKKRVRSAGWREKK